VNAVTLPTASTAGYVVEPAHHPAVDAVGVGRAGHRGLEPFDGPPSPERREPHGEDEQGEQEVRGHAGPEREVTGLAGVRVGVRLEQALADSGQQRDEQPEDGEHQRRHEQHA
jgi:hypothetical protein